MYICMYFFPINREKSHLALFSYDITVDPLSRHTHIPNFLLPHCWNCYHLVNDRSTRSMISHSASGRLGFWDGRGLCRSSQWWYELRQTTHINVAARNNHASCDSHPRNCTLVHIPNRYKELLSFQWQCSTPSNMCCYYTYHIVMILE